MSQYTVLLDANVLYPAPIRDLLLQLAVADLFRARLKNSPYREQAYLATLTKQRFLVTVAELDQLIFEGLGASRCAPTNPPIGVGRVLPIRCSLKCLHSLPK